MVHMYAGMGRANDSGCAYSCLGPFGHETHAQQSLFERNGLMPGVASERLACCSMCVHIRQLLLCCVPCRRVHVPLEQLIADDEWCNTVAEMLVLGERAAHTSATHGAANH